MFLRLLCSALVLSALSSCAHSQVQNETCSAVLSAIDLEAQRVVETLSPGIAIGISIGDNATYARGYGSSNLEHDVRMGPDSPFLTASITKQFAAVGTLLLVEDGVIDLQETISKYVSDIPNAEEITIYQLLTQTSGIPNVTRYRELRKSMAQRKELADPLTELTAILAEKETKSYFEPGSAWGYSNTNYLILGVIIEQASGQSLADFFRERLFEPAGLEHTRFDDPRHIAIGRAQGYVRIEDEPPVYGNADWIFPPFTAGGIRSTINDLLKWNQALYGGQILSEQSLEMMTTKGRLSDGRLVGDELSHDIPEMHANADYAMGIFVDGDGEQTRYWHTGHINGFSNWLAHYPETKLSIAISLNVDGEAAQNLAIEPAALALQQSNCQSSDIDSPSADRIAAPIDHAINVDGHIMKARTFGLSDRTPGEPLVVFENGSLSPLESWADVPSQVAKSAPVVLYDRATIGGSEWDGEIGTPEHVASRLWALLEELDAPPPYILVGWSWGGDLIRYHAARAPEDVVGLVYVDAAVHSPAAEMEMMEAYGLGEAGFNQKVQILAEQAEKDLTPAQRADIQYIDDLLAQRKEHPYGDVPPIPMVALVAGTRQPPPPEFQLDLPLGFVEQHLALLPGKIDRLEQWVRGSENGVLIFADQSRHFMQGDETELVVSAIKRVIALAQE